MLFKNRPLRVRVALLMACSLGFGGSLECIADHMKEWVVSPDWALIAWVAGLFVVCSVLTLLTYTGDIDSKGRDAK